MNIFHRYTLQSLKKNKTRTIVTIIGIILSVAMFTATTESLASAQHYMLKCTEATTGSFYLNYSNLDSKTVAEIGADEEVQDMTVVKYFGYANIGSGNEFKPYLFIEGVDEDYTDLVASRLKEGRMPEREGEIVLPYHLKTDGGVNIKIGDKLTLDVGKRTSDGAALWQGNPFVPGEEVLSDTVKKTYTVVGICERSNRFIEPYEAPGYTAYTLTNNEEAEMSSVFLTTKHIRQVKSFVQARNEAYGSPACINTDYLSFSGASLDDNIMFFLTGFGAALIILIMFGSIALIYNSFSISVSERTKQFGLLKSIGATKKQMMNSVIFEAAFLSIIGVPLGLLSGCLGIGVTFACLSDKFDAIFSLNVESVSMQLHINVWALIAAAVISVITTLISAYIPAKRAVKISAIDAIRQSNDIKTKARSVKTSILTKKLFGFEGMLASKNFKRNRKKYRTTVLSLFVSIVLFVSASSFCSYFAKSFEYEVTTNQFDIVVMAGGHENQDELFRKLGSVDGVTQYAAVNGYNENFYFERADINSDYTDIDKYLSDSVDTTSKYYQHSSLVSFVFVDDIEFKKLLEANKLNVSDFMNPSKPKAVLYDSVMRGYTDENNKDRMKKTSLLSFDGKEKTINLVTMKLDEKYKNYYLFNVKNEGGKVLYGFEKYVEDGEDVKVWLDENDIMSGGKMVTIGAKIEELPYFISGGSTTALIYPKSAEKAIGLDKNDNNLQSSAYYISDNHKLSAEKMGEVIDGGDYKNIYFNDYAENVETMRALITIIRVFSYGFITLISLIAVANVFNTISTNISLRRREFAMLKSVGMTPKGFNRIMNFESLLYGIKSLLYGLPVSVLTTYGFFRLSVGTGHDMEFYVPWASFIIVIVSVFAVVFASMIYSMSKIKKDNPIDALKNENI